MAFLRPEITALLLPVALLVSACSSDSVVDEQEAPVPESNELMRFTSYNVNEQAGTRAGSSLNQGFLVSCWKDFAGAKQQDVMGKYEVQYKQNAWYGTSEWCYIGEPESFYQRQIERYWDFYNFPYRFHAISPCPSHDDIASFTLDGQKLTIPQTVTYSYQTATDGALSIPTPQAEPYLVAQVSRDGEGKDLDHVIKDANGNPVQINTTSATLNRSVALPFHHLTSKVRFGIYCNDDDAASIADDRIISDVIIKVISTGFTTTAKGFEATGLTTGSMMDGTFGPKTTTDAGVTLLTAATGATDIDPKRQLNQCTSQAKAYMCEVPDGLLQIPQQNVEMTVTVKIGDVTYHDEHVVLTLPDNTTTTQFTWDPNTIYTYYIVLQRFDPRPIHFTCVLQPWQDISGSLSTDLEK